MPIHTAIQKCSSRERCTTPSILTYNPAREAQSDANQSSGADYEIRVIGDPDPLRDYHALLGCPGR
jgi:hypothetical protein